MSADNRRPTDADLAVIENQLGRTPRDVHAIAYRCPCGKPAVVETPPRLSADLVRRASINFCIGLHGEPCLLSDFTKNQCSVRATKAKGIR